MQPKQTISRIARKEIHLFFASPIAYLFLAAFIGVSLFIFFWVESFFSRNIADVRPLFEWMPVLLIFLASTLTMRMWSEERRTGTLEHVLTQPVPLWHFVVGKFLACFFLLLVALFITLPLPISVAIMAHLDWGPVIAGYLATLFLGAAYLSIGLFVSSRCQNQIVSLMGAAALSGFFYLLGSNTITHFVGNTAGEWLRLLGTGSRFESIARGVLDIRDIAYYLSLVAIFLALNSYSLERERWALTGNREHHRQWHWITGLIAANALLASVWLGEVHWLRWDVTAGKQYSISPATRTYLGQLQEPLLLRAYFSSKTHPLLAPLVPQLRDLLKEYEVAGAGKVRVEIVDPVASPELEKEANEKYAIKPMPFQVNDRYQASVVNSYFNVLVKYGDEYQVLGFRDLIEAKTSGESNIDVQLRNPEHDITSAIKKVLHSYQAGGNLFDTVKGNLEFKGYVSADALLPEKLKAYKKTLATELDKLAAKSSGRLHIEFIEPEAEGGKVAAQIDKDYGFKPMTTNLLSNERFYFYLTLGQGKQVVQIPLDDMSAASAERNLSAAIKRFATGFTKTIVMVTPEATPNPYGMAGVQFNALEQLLSANFTIVHDNLSSGHVPGQADLLLVMAPDNMNEKQVFALDQFLMQGGTVILATAPHNASFTEHSLMLQKHTSGLQAWLKHQGITLDDNLVMDKQNVPFPIPVTRNIGGFAVQEIRMLDYPYFVDVRGDGLNANNPITSNLPQVTMAWASPIVLDNNQQKGRHVTELLRSSTRSWLGSSANVMPQITANGLTAYLPSGEQKSHLLGAVIQGRFDSFFSGKPSPLLAATADKAATPSSPAAANALGGVIQHSPDSARIVVFGSNDFLADAVLNMASTANGSQYLNSLQLLANTCEWAVEDAGLLSIRSRSHFNRTLPVMEHGTQLFWEYLNYGLAVIALMLLGIIQYQVKRRRERQYLQWFAH